MVIFCGVLKSNMNFFDGFDQNVKRIGINKASKILINNLGLIVEKNLKDFPKKGPVLIYSNHPTGLDPFILASVFDRNDFLFLGDVYHLSKGKNVSKHIAPTMPTEKFIWEFVKRRPTNWPGFIKMRLLNKLNYKNAKTTNRYAIEKIINNLENGHLSLVFPSGGEYEFLPWKKGVYKIFDELKRREIKFSLYKIDIKYLSEFKLIFHFLFFRKFFNNVLIQGKKVSRIIK